MDNLNVVIEDLSVEDGRWEDEGWLTEQATISAKQDAVDNGVEVE